MSSEPSALAGEVTIRSHGIIDEPASFCVLFSDSRRRPILSIGQLGTL